MKIADNKKEVTAKVDVHYGDLPPKTKKDEHLSSKDPLEIQVSFKESPITQIDVKIQPQNKI